MSHSHLKVQRVQIVCIISFLVLLFLPSAGSAEQAGIKKILIGQNPLSVHFHVTGKIPVKVVKVEPRELLVALKNVTLEKGFKVEGSKNNDIVNVAVEKLSGNVVAVVLTVKKPLKVITSSFNSSNSIFQVTLEKKAAGSSKKSETQPVAATGTKKESSRPAVAKTETTTKAKSAIKPEVSSDKVVEKKETAPIVSLPKPKTIDSKKLEKRARGREVSIPTPVVYVPPDREKSKFKGDVSDIVQKIAVSSCESNQIDTALKLLKKQLYAQAYELLDQYILQENLSCTEEAFFLRAFALFKSVKKEDYAQMLNAERLFQDALISYPKSEYIPYGYAAIGLIQKSLNNVSAAEGYFNIIKQGYLEYTGLAEIMFHLAQIYDTKGYQDKALTYYKQVFEDTEVNSYIADAGVGYGKALYTKRQYLDALSIMNYVVASNPKKVYESSDLLLYIGNANYEVGLAWQARESLTRVLNLFPDIEQPDIILSRIGDTYGMENNEEKAIKVYELVREKYPDTEGFIASSIGIARYLKRDKEKMEIYLMIKTKFPDNKFSRIAMMRMAEIYQKNGEYNKCIKEIEDLLSTHPRGLRYEAVKLMQKAYEQLFKKELKTDEYTRVLNRYELEHNRIDRMGSRQLELSVGLAYLEAKLYEEAFNHLITAYKQYKRSSRSAELLYGLGVAMDESGRDDDALKLFDAFAKRFTRSKYRQNALLRSGQIYSEKKKYKLSSKKFDVAYNSGKSRLEKGEILMSHANVLETKGDFSTASNLREKAVKEIAMASGKNYDALAFAYRELGRTYIVLKKYVKSADAYDKALNFSKDEREKANLGFLLGDAYQKGNIISKAKDAYKQVVESYDSVWARMAQQRLSTLELAETVQNS